MLIEGKEWALNMGRVPGAKTHLPRLRARRIIITLLLYEVLL